MRILILRDMVKVEELVDMKGVNFCTNPILVIFAIIIVFLGTLATFVVDTLWLINRFCANSRWINLFPRFSNHYLTLYTSDHNSILLELFSKYDCMPIDKHIYYIKRFKQLWPQNNESFDVVKATWNSNNFHNRRWKKKFECIPNMTNNI